MLALRMNEFGNFFVARGERNSNEANTMRLAESPLEGIILLDLLQGIVPVKKVNGGEMLSPLILKSDPNSLIEPVQFQASPARVS
jgi:hypothetical protein